MHDGKTDKAAPAKTPEAARAARLKAALKANIAKRKAQARARSEGATPPKNDKE